jgi:O-antigen ligase
VYSLLVERGTPPVRAHWLTLAIVAFLVVSIVSAIGALDPSSSTNKLFLLITAVGVFFAVRQTCVARGQLTVVAAGAVVGLLLASLQGIEQHLLHQWGVAGFLSTSGEFVGRVQGSFGHPNQYGGYLAFLMPLAGALVLTRQFGARLRLLAAVALTASVPALVFSYARGAILALVLGVLVWFALVRPRYAVGAAVVIGTLALFFAPGTLKERFNPQIASGDVPVRTDVWGAAIDIYDGHPWFGVGLGNFGNAYKALPSTLQHASQRRLLNQSGLLIPPHAQNLYLNVMAEEGVFGIATLVLLLLGAGAVAYRSCRSPDARGRAIGLGLGAGIATLALHSILEVTLLTELSLPLFALLAAGLAIVGFDAEDRRPTPS